MLHEFSDNDAYELFRSAIVARSADAWATIYDQYHLLMLGWARQCCNKNYLNDSPEDIADRAFARAWTALVANQQIAQFQTIASLLAYLRNCVTAAVIDETRSAGVRERICKHMEVAEVATPEDEVVESALRHEVWQVLMAQPLSPSEWTVLRGTFVLGQPPRDIQHDNPHLFTDITQVYTIKRNVLSRLKHCQGLQALYEQLSA